MIGSFLLKVIATCFQSVFNCDVCSRRELNADVVLSGGTDISFQSVMNFQACIRKELYAESRVVGGTTMCQGLVERMT